MVPALRLPFDHKRLIEIARKHWRLVALPAAAGFVLSLFFLMFRGQEWGAHLAFVLRDEAAGSTFARLGRFDNNDAMKSAQETIGDMARSEAVVTAALVRLGPESGRADDSWPPRSAIESTRGVIEIRAPKGAEFGKTEILHLSVRAKTRQRAMDLAAAVSDSLDGRLRELRDRKAQSVVEELEQRAALARADLSKVTGELETLETGVGEDLGELRILNQAGAGESNLRTQLNNIKTELRAARLAGETNRELMDVLQASVKDTKRLVATPNRLLESQPALRRLKDGLVDAQLRTADLKGKMTPEHPQVRGAVIAEKQVRDELHRELVLAIRGLQTELKVNAVQIEALEKQQAEVVGRLDRLATLRAKYANVASEVEQRSQLLDKVQRDLSDAQASRAAAKSSSLITRVDGPVGADRPSGPGKTTVVFGGTLGGALAGLGLLFLMFTPLQQSTGRRWSDLLPMGRRAGDAIGRRVNEWVGRGRRATDPECETPARGPVPPSPTSGQAGPPSSASRRTTDAPPPPPPPSPPSPPPTSSDDRRQGDRRRGNRR